MCWWACIIPAKPSPPVRTMIVVEGTVKLTVDGRVTLLTEGQSTYISLGAVDRMENLGKVPICTGIEV
jgi:mannose-6-phosphate isomerase-like protein (cupin superfamily)